MSLSLDYLPAHTLCWKTLYDAGLVDARSRPTVSMNLAELIVATEVLAEPAITLHYFWRRSEYETHAVYFGDEEDLLVFYLSNGFAEIIATSKAGPAKHMLSGGNSERLRRYYMAVWHGDAAEVPPPRRILTPRWLKIVKRLQTRRRPEKWDIASALLDVSFVNQKATEQRLTGLLEHVRTRRKRATRDACFVLPPSTESHCGIIFFASQGIPSEERSQRVGALI